MIDRDSIFLILRMHHEGDKLVTVVAGKFLLDDEHGFEVLEDCTDGWLTTLQKESPGKISRTIERISNSMYWKVVSLEDVRQGKVPELIKEHQAPPAQGPESVFEYHRQGLPHAQSLEFHNGTGYLDGHKLEPQDLQKLLDNVQHGIATLGYGSKEEPVQKTEEFFMSMSKAEGSGMGDVLSRLRAAAKAGHISPEDVDAITRDIFVDSKVPSMGNLKAYRDFLSRPKSGVHVRMDGNDFGTINKTLGWETGEKTITALGTAIREALDESVGRSTGKAFHLSGDEFHAFVPDFEQAALFARAVRTKLEAIPAIGGVHALSLSIGFGPTPEHAEFAMINAKEAKNRAGAAPGVAKTFAASQIPGYEGLVPTGQDQLNLEPLPADVKGPLTGQDVKPNSGPNLT